MKKLLLLGLLFATPVYAGTISLGTISADATPGGINDNFTTIANAINGQIQGSATTGSSTNVLADSIGELDMGDEINPRVRDAEIFGIGADSVSGGQLTQAALVESGCVPADDSDLTSNISACIAYVNGYRVSKTATAITYTASRDCYVDLSQTGNYNTTCVTNGATQPSVAANSVRLAKVVTDGTEITTVTSLYTTRVPGLIIPAHYRTGMYVSRDSATTIAVLPGSIEINNSMISKSSTTTLTLGTAGDWAGGTSLTAANTTGFVGIDASGNLRLHTTAPTHDNYAVSTTVGKKRYATWSSTVYRILGWFRMNAASQIYTSEIGNIKEGDVGNNVISSDATNFALNASTTVNTAEINYYTSGGQVSLQSIISGDVGAAWDGDKMTFTVDGNAISGCSSSGGTGAAASFLLTTGCLHTTSQGTHTYRVSSQNLDGSDAATLRTRVLMIRED